MASAMMLTSSASAFAGKTIRPRTAVRAQAKSSVVTAAARPLWYPGGDAPKYLDGSLPGDYGFDPLKLGDDKDNLRWFVQAELIHCRTAMMAVAGILFPAIATKTGAVNIPEWYESGEVVIKNSSIPFSALLFVQLLLCGWVEIKRWEDFKNPGSQADGSFLGITEEFKGNGNGYPGGRFFDPFGISKGSEEKLAEYKVKEVKNGRLAMVALVGFVAQHAAYPGTGPIDNLLAHIADPYHVTFATNGVSLPLLPAVQ